MVSIQSTIKTFPFPPVVLAFPHAETVELPQSNNLQRSRRDIFGFFNAAAEAASNVVSEVADAVSSVVSGNADAEAGSSAPVNPPVISLYGVAADEVSDTAVDDASNEVSDATGDLTDDAVDEVSSVIGGIVVVNSDGAELDQTEDSSDFDPVGDVLAEVGNTAAAVGATVAVIAEAVGTAISTATNDTFGFAQNAIGGIFNFAGIALSVFNGLNFVAILFLWGQILVSVLLAIFDLYTGNLIGAATNVVKAIVAVINFPF